ncbi:MAG TPA: D-alanyl-D-alanine carboxypeptidase family protein [Actinoplanes sp.]|nr:D-alanyl-D-alanine carboxypeptidase family protein [Actinoplanes sp.]
MLSKRLAAAVTLTLATAAPVLAVPAAAQAAVPAVAKNWSALMYRSLTADTTMATLRTTLATQKKALLVRHTEVTVATKSDSAAQRTVSAATVAHQDARDRLAAAEERLKAAKGDLTLVNRQRPRKKAAVDRAKKAVVTATTTRDIRRKKLHDAAALLAAARTSAKGTAAELGTAVAAHVAATTAIEQTQTRISTAPTAAALAAQAATVSRSVVDQVRPSFTVADTSSVYGVTVHRNVAFAFKRMVDDAAKAGVQISGGGFRTKERQIELRTINGCPDVWTAPSSSCRVPTAIPGRSLHEIGLAVDISSGGKTISRKTKAFTWLQANAAKYGYVNLPSEAWHWSITGN